MPEFSHHIGWLKPIADATQRIETGTETPDDRGLLTREGFATCNDVLNQNPESVLAKNIQKRIARIFAPATHELSSEHADKEKMDKALNTAKEMSIVREELFPATLPSNQHIYILSSDHYPPFIYDPAKVNAETKRGQTQLFQLLYLMKKEGMNSALLVEGSERQRKGRIKFPYERPCIDYKGQILDIHEPLAQDLLFQSPTMMTKVMDEQQRRVAPRKGDLPIFFEYSDYPIDGLHSLDTMKESIAFAEWVKKYAAFRSKYLWMVNVLKQTPSFVPEKDPDGQKYILFANGKKISTNEYLTDMTIYEEAIQKSNENFASRDIDAVSNLLATRELPLCWVGSGHSINIQKQVGDKAHVHIITPIAATLFDDHRLSSFEEIETKHYALGLFREMAKHAQQVERMQ